MSITHPTTLSLLYFARNLNSDAKPKKLLILDKYSTDDPSFNDLQGNKVLSTMILSTMSDIVSLRNGEVYEYGLW